MFWYKVQTISMQIRLLPFINEIKSYFNHYFFKKNPYCKYSKLTKTIGVMIIEMRIKVNLFRQFSIRLKTVRSSTLSLQSLGCIGPSPCSLSWLSGTSDQLLLSLCVFTRLHPKNPFFLAIRSKKILYYSQLTYLFL